MPDGTVGQTYEGTPAVPGKMLRPDDSILDIATLLSSMLTAMQNIDIDIDSVNINTDEVESILNQIRTLTIDANNILAASAADLAAIEILITATNALLTTIDADTGAMVTDLAALEVLSTAANALLTTIDADTGSMLLNQTNKAQMTQITDGTNEADVIATILSLKSDLSSIAGTVTDVDQGNASAGTQRIALATDDFAVVALQIIDNMVGVIDSAHGTGVAVMGGKAESTVPTEVADADAVAVWMDTFGRIVDAAHDLATQTQMVTDASPAQMQKMFETGWAALTAPAQETPELNVRDYENITFTTVVDIGGNTSVDVIFWGSIDGGTNWFQMGDTEQYTASGTYAVTFTGVAVERVKVEFDAEAGDTDATVTPMVGAGN